MNFTDKIRKIGLGSVQFGTCYGISNRRGQTSLSEVGEIIDFSRKSGIGYIDTASGYGEAEEALGKFQLNDFKIVSKYLASENSVANIVSQFSNSLKSMHIDRLYGYMFHRPNYLIDNPHCWSVFLELKNKGKVKKIGYSLNEVSELEELLKLGFFPDIVQVPYNLFDNRFESHLIELKANGCEIHTRSTFLQGLFFMDTEKLHSFFDSVKTPIKNLQTTYKSDLSSALLDYSISKDFIDVVIIGVETAAQLKVNVQNLNRSYPIRLGGDITIPSNILKPFMWPTTK